MVMMDRSSIVFRIDSKLLQHRPPRLTLAGTLRTLGGKVESGELDASVVVDILAENRLLPYIISRPKDLNNVALGQITNASKVGDIIVSEECIKGTYELCLSFLEFVLIILKNPDYIDSSKTMLACVTYIANEIYPNHHIWTYRTICNMYEILSFCTDIFHEIIVNTSRNDVNFSSSIVRMEADYKQQIRYEDLSELEIVTIISLSQNQAHKQLLDAIVDGKQIIKKLIAEDTFAGEMTLKDAPAVSYVRQSLSIFDKLIACCSSVITQTSQQASQRQQTDQSAPMTNIEKAIFDTSVRPGLLQTLFSYAYQREDIRTACIVIDLVKRIAEKFSMSLMVCLGSEADRACQFFIECLDGHDPNTDLVVVIVDLLSTCVRHQPGLIELFLNYNNGPKLSADQQQQEGDKSNQKKQVDTLNIVMKLLRECCDQPTNSHKTLHSQIMRFIMTFWQKSHSSIEQFDKLENFWDLITHPLLRFVDGVTQGVSNQQNIYEPIQVLDDKLNSYALMIFAREIFNVNSGITDRKLNPKLLAKLEELNSKSFMSYYSTFVMKRHASTSSNLDKSEDYNRVVAAWRDFLASYSRFEPFKISQQVKNQIINNLLSCLAAELRLEEKLNRERIAAIGDTLLLVWLRWIGKDSAGDDIFNSIHEILHLAYVSKEHLPFLFLLTFQSMLNLYLARSRDYLIKSTRSFDLLVPALQMMQFSLRIFEKSMQHQNNGNITDRLMIGIMKDSSSNSSTNNYKPSIESRICEASITTFRFIVDITRSHVHLWIAYVRANLNLDSLVQFLTMLSNKKQAPDVCLALVELLIVLASIHQIAEYLKKSKLLGKIGVIAKSLHEQCPKQSSHPSQ